MFSLRKCLITANLIIATGLFSAVCAAGEYYRWIGADGVTHYGATPPQGVKAELVNTRGDGARSPIGSNPISNTDQQAQSEQSVVEQQKKLIAQRKSECAQEKSRLSTLKTNGSRIRMQQADGTSRFLSPEEIANEISMSETFLKDACGS